MDEKKKVINEILNLVEEILGDSMKKAAVSVDRLQKILSDESLYRHSISKFAKNFFGSGAEIGDIYVDFHDDKDDRFLTVYVDVNVEIPYLEEDSCEDIEEFEDYLREPKNKKEIIDDIENLLKSFGFLTDYLRVEIGDDVLFGKPAFIPVLIEYRVAY